MGLDHLVDFRYGTALDMPFKAGTFDVAWGVDAWCHITDKEKLIQECARVVKPGGTIAFMDEIQIGEMTDEECKKFLFPQAVPYLETLEGYASLLEKAGFTVLEGEDITGEVMEYWRRVWMDEIKAKKDQIVGKFGNEMYANMCMMMENLFTAVQEKKIGEGRFIGKRR